MSSFATEFHCEHFYHIIFSPYDRSWRECWQTECRHRTTSYCWTAKNIFWPRNYGNTEKHYLKLYHKFKFSSILQVKMSALKCTPEDHQLWMNSSQLWLRPVFKYLFKGINIRSIIVLVDFSGSVEEFWGITDCDETTTGQSKRYSSSSIV